MTKRISPEIKAMSDDMRDIFAAPKPDRIVPRDQKTIIPLVLDSLPAHNGEEVEVVLAVFGPTGRPRAEHRLSAQTARWMAQKIIEKLGAPPSDEPAEPTP